MATQGPLSENGAGGAAKELDEHVDVELVLRTRAAGGMGASGRRDR